MRKNADFQPEKSRESLQLSLMDVVLVRVVVMHWQWN